MWALGPQEQSPSEWKGGSIQTGIIEPSEELKRMIFPWVGDGIEELAEP